MVTYLYRMSNVLGPATSAGVPFELVGLAGEQVASREIRAFSYAEAFGTSPNPYDPGHGVPVLLEPVPFNDTAPASIVVTDPATPVTGRFIDQGMVSPYGTVFVRSIWLFDQSGVAPEVSLTLNDVSIVVKSTWTRLCPDGYSQQVYRPEFFPDSVVSRISTVCPLVPDLYSINPILTITETPGVHNAYPGTERVFDGARYAFGVPVGELLAGTYTEMLSGFAACFPNASDLDPMLDDTGVCP